MNWKLFKKDSKELIRKISQSEDICDEYNRQYMSGGDHPSIMVLDNMIQLRQLTDRYIKEIMNTNYSEKEINDK